MGRRSKNAKWLHSELIIATLGLMELKAISCYRYYLPRIVAGMQRPAEKPPDPGRKGHIPFASQPYAA